MAFYCWSIVDHSEQTGIVSSVVDAGFKNGAHCPGSSRTSTAINIITSEINGMRMKLVCLHSQSEIVPASTKRRWECRTTGEGFGGGGGLKQVKPLLAGSANPLPISWSLSRWETWPTSPDKANTIEYLTDKRATPSIIQLRCADRY